MGSLEGEFFHQVGHLTRGGTAVRSERGDTREEVPSEKWEMEEKRERLLIFDF